MKKSVFLSASVPDLARKPQYADCKPLAIRDAVLALAMETSIRNIPLIFGGHPSITVFLARWAKHTGQVDHVTLYQSRFFEDQFPPEIKAIPELKLVDKVAGKLLPNLTHFRQVMLSENNIGLGVFMGGMDGLQEERDILQRSHPKAVLMPMIQLGGQTRDIFPKESLDPLVKETFETNFSPGGRFAAILDRLAFGEPSSSQG
ncbi:MAG: hypothetical protein HQL52_19610 [Magnetococcales bacterium]|nr:hypothetical protein [Magnetococcales bacterium]